MNTKIAVLPVLLGVAVGKPKVKEFKSTAARIAVKAWPS
jgi:hypothetical protein